MKYEADKPSLLLETGRPIAILHEGQEKEGTGRPTRTRQVEQARCYSER